VSRRRPVLPGERGPSAGRHVGQAGGLVRRCLPAAVRRFEAQGAAGASTPVFLRRLARGGPHPRASTPRRPYLFSSPGGRSPWPARRLEEVLPPALCSAVWRRGRSTNRRSICLADERVRARRCRVASGMPTPRAPAAAGRCSTRLKAAGSLSAERIGRATRGLRSLDGLAGRRASDGRRQRPQVL